MRDVARMMRHWHQNIRMSMGSCMEEEVGRSELDMKELVATGRLAIGIDLPGIALADAIRNTLSL